MVIKNRQKYLEETNLIDYSNKEVNAQFNPPYEQLAFELGEDEFDLPEVLAEPLDEVIRALKTHGCYAEMVENFPDVKNKKGENLSL